MLYLIIHSILFTMQPSEVSELHYLFPTQFPPSPVNVNYHQLSARFPYQLLPDLSPCFSSNSTSDEAEEQQLSVINERKQRRMISNRESARRSRMRKQKHLDELWSQVVWLRNENHQLVEKLGQVSDHHDQLVQENAALRQEASELRQMLAEMHLNNLITDEN